MILCPLRLGMLENTKSNLKLFNSPVLSIEKKNIFVHAMRYQKFLPILAKSWRCYKFVERIFVLNRNSNVALNGKLKVLLKMNLKSESALLESSQNSDVEKRNDALSYRLKEFDSFEKLLDSEASSDVTFIVEGKKIHAHKTILVCRSPVFEEMLQRYTKGNQEDTFEIAGIKYEVMKELLRFVYIGKVSNIDQQTTDLLIAADKYSIDGLKVLCEKALYKKLSINNALEYLILAAICDTTMLKAQVIEFIVHNVEDIVKKKEFELFGALDSKVIADVVRAIAEKESKQ